MSNATETQSKALPNEWIDRLFLRLATIYGMRFADLWRDIDPAAVKASWAVALGGFHGKHIGDALDALVREGRTFPPTLPEFVALCTRAKGSTLPAHQPALHLPAPELTDEEKAKAAEMRRAAIEACGRSASPRAWAYRVKAAHEAGNRNIAPVTLANALEAIRTDPDREARTQGATV